MKQFNLKAFVKKLRSKLTYNHVKNDLHRFGFISTLRSQSTYNLVAIMALIVSVFTLILNHQTNRRANEFSYTANNLTSQVNSAEFELYKKLKYDALDMIAKLKAIDAIAAVAPHVSETIDYSREIEFLRKLQASPVYPLILYSVKDDDERLLLETRIRLLTTSKFSSYELRGWIHQIVKTIEEDLDFKKYAKMDFDTLIKDLCTMQCTFTAFDFEEWKKRNIDIKGNQTIIIDSTLNKNNISENVVPMANDGLKDKKVKIQGSIAKGGNANLKESHGHIDFQMFINYLIDECKVKDSDVLLFYGVFKNDTVIIQKAIDEGANINVKDKQIINKYQKEYESLINK